MSLTITIFGTYFSPIARPLSGVTLEFETLYNSSQTQVRTDISVTTADDGSYSIELVPNTYKVRERDSAGWSKELGIIQIFPDSQPGTLNEYLTSFTPDQAQPDILTEMEELLAETKQVASNAGINPCGTYDETTQYVLNDLVGLQGSQYRATAEVQGISPPESPWELFVAAGEKGPPNSLDIGSVQTLPAGQGATAEITGDTPNQVLNLGIPEGGEGNPGPANILQVGTVKTLAPGEQATAEITGDTPNQVLNLGIPEGGEGNPGPANILQVGTVKTLAPGEQATAEITGDTPNQVLNLGIPEGGEGNPGPANILQVGTVKTLAPGEQATAEITGDTPNQVLNLGIPEGGEGKPGPAGSVTSVSGITPDASGAVYITGSTGRFLNPNTPTTYTPTTEFLIETAYIHLDSADFTVDLTGIESAHNAGSLDAGYTLRIVIGTNNAARTVTFQTNGYLNWIDGAVRKSPVMALSRSYSYLLQVMAVAGSPLFVVQLSPAV